MVFGLVDDALDFGYGLITDPYQEAFDLILPTKEKTRTQPARNVLITTTNEDSDKFSEIVMEAFPNPLSLTDGKVGGKDIIAPFSRATPSSLWPYVKDDGTRATAYDFATTEIPLLEPIFGVEKDFGDLPLFEKWGDLAMATPPVVVYLAFAVGIVTIAPVIGGLFGSAFSTGMAT